MSVDLKTIVNAIKTQLILDDTATDDYWGYSIIYSDMIKISAKFNNAPSPKFTGDRDILIRIGSAKPIEGFVGGSGRIASFVKRHLEIVIRTRLQLDVSDREDEMLFNESYGHCIMEEFIIDRLQLFDPLSNTGSRLLMEPMRLDDNYGSAYSDPAQYSQGQDRATPAYGQSLLAFEIKYAPTLRC